MSKRAKEIAELCKRFAAEDGNDPLTILKQEWDEYIKPEDYEAAIEILEKELKGGEHV